MSKELSAPVYLHQRAIEFELLLDVYRREKPTTVLEIGVAEGGTLWHWLTYARDDVPVDVVAVDTFDGSHTDNRLIFPTWAPSNVTLHVVAGRSDDPATVAQVFAIAPRFDFVFVDADHSYAAARGDWETYGKTAHTVAFHDLYADVRFHPEIEVGKLWSEIADEYESVEFALDRSAAWGGIGVVWPGSPLRAKRAPRRDPTKPERRG